MGWSTITALVVRDDVRAGCDRSHVGTYEWLGVASLGLLGIDNEPALAFTILLHAAWYVPTTLFGAVALGTRGVRRIRGRRAGPARPGIGRS